MRRALHVIVFATLFLTAGCVGSSSGGDIVATSPPATSATDVGRLRSLTAAVCAPSSEPCEDTYVSELDGACTTKRGRDCTEAQADAALRRWVSHGGPEGAGDTELLAILNEHTIVVGYAFGSNLSFTGSRIEEADDRVVVVLTFDAAPDRTGDGQPLFFTLELRTDREIVTIPTPIGRRTIEINVEVHPSQ